MSLSIITEAGRGEDGEMWSDQPDEWQGDNDAVMYCARIVAQLWWPVARGEASQGNLIVEL